MSIVTAFVVKTSKNFIFLHQSKVVRLLIKKNSCKYAKIVFTMWAYMNAFKRFVNTFVNVVNLYYIKATGGVQMNKINRSIDHLSNQIFEFCSDYFTIPYI